MRGFRWNVEQFHRETKQLSGIEEISTAKRIIKSHISCAILFGFVSNKWLWNATNYLSRNTWPFG
jgi:hypothetical protein